MDKCRSFLDHLDDKSSNSQGQERNFGIVQMKGLKPAERKCLQENLPQITKRILQYDYGGLMQGKLKLDDTTPNTEKVTNTNLQNILQNFCMKKKCDRSDERLYFQRQFCVVDKNIEDWGASKELKTREDAYMEEFITFFNSVNSLEGHSMKSQEYCGKCQYKKLDEGMENFMSLENASARFDRSLNRYLKIITNTLRRYEEDRMILVKWNDKILSDKAYERFEKQVGKVALLEMQRFNELQGVCCRQSAIKSELEIDVKYLQSLEFKLEVNDSTLKKLVRKHFMEKNKVVLEAGRILDMNTSSMSIKEITDTISKKSLELESAIFLSFSKENL